MRQLALRFILKSGAFIHSGPMPEQQAREKVRLLVTGDYKLRNILRYGDHTHPEGAWMVDLADVAAVHTFDPLEMGQPQGQQMSVTMPQTASFNFSRSGV